MARCSAWRRLLEYLAEWPWRSPEYTPGVHEFLLQNDRGERKWLAMDPDDAASIERFLDDVKAFMGDDNGRQK